MCSSQAAKEVFKDAQQTIASTYSFFKNSSERTQKLHEMETLLDGSVLKLKEPMEVRWLSLGEAVNTFYRVWNAVVLALDSEATIGSSQSKAKGILKKVHNLLLIIASASYF